MGFLRNGKQGGAQSCVSARTNVRFTPTVMQRAHDVFRDDVAKIVARITGKGVRTTQYWIAGSRTMDVDDFVALASHKSHGHEFIAAFMAAIPEAQRERWVKDQINNAKVAAAERRAQRALRERDQLLLSLKS